LGAEAQDVDKVATAVREAGRAQGTRGRMGWGWGIWHILCIKDHVFTISRGPQTGAGGLSPMAPSLNHWI